MRSPGGDPAEERIQQRKAFTVKELCSRYLAAADNGLILGKGDRPKKASSLYIDRGRINRHIVPLLGNKRVQSLKPADFNKFVEDVASGKFATIEKTAKKRGKYIVKGGLGTAARTVGLLGGILTYAVEQGLIEKNPAHGIRKPADGVKKRRLSDDAYRLLGQFLQEKAADEQFETTVQIVRHLALTACRRGEAIRLTRPEIDVDGSCLRLNDSKEGASVRPVGLPVLDLLAPLLCDDDDEDFVFKGTVEGKPLVGFPKLWKKLFRGTALADITPHVLRHSFSSIESRPTPNIHMGRPVAGCFVTDSLLRFNHVVSLRTVRASEGPEVVAFRQLGNTAQNHLSVASAATGLFDQSCGLWR